MDKLSIAARLLAAITVAAPIAVPVSAKAASQPGTSLWLFNHPY